MSNEPTAGVRADGVGGAIQEGHYAKKQLFCKDWLISWSHRSRFELGLRLARSFAGKRLLDHGCGDGTFLAMLMESEYPPSEAVGTEIHASLVDDCTRRFGDRSGLRFVHTEELERADHRHAYDAVICMEVLEHVVELEAEVARLGRLLAPGGTLVVSVPVETGPALLIKQAVRRIAGWRGLGDYPGSSPYTTGELARSVFAGPSQHIVRPVHGVEEGSPYHCHKGFNWKRLRDVLTRRFELERVLVSPVSWLPPALGSQVWLIARAPGGSGA